jgi:hypothetical protein
MNDTEAETRRLLAAATEDMPLGTGLLDGFEAALRRSRTRRIRGGVALSAGIAAAAAAVAAVVLTIGSAPPALAAVTSALTRTLAQSYHLTDRTSTYYVINGRIRYPSHGTCTTEEDPVRHLAATTCSNGAAYREVGGYSYSYIPYPVGHPGRHWDRLPTASIVPPAAAPNSVAVATPQQMLAEIEKADKVTVVGPVSGPGWTGTRYAFSGPGTDGIGLSGTVDVDQQGRARALDLTIRTPNANNTLVFMWVQALTFSDFGARVTVTPPPANQTFDGP